MKEKEIKKVLNWIKKNKKEQLEKYFSSMLRSTIDKEVVSNTCIIERAKKFREDLIKKQTKSEVQFKAYLKSHGIKYDFQKIFYCHTNNKKIFFIADFYLNEGNIVIEIDGGVHEDRKDYDKKRTSVLKKNGIKTVYRFTNEELTNQPDYVNNRLREIKKECFRYNGLKV